jgi:hypothetical protein
VLHQAGAFFVTRAKSNLKCRRIYSHPVDRSTGLVCDQTIELTVFCSQRGYPRTAAAHPLQGPGERQDAGVSHQPCRHRRRDRLRAVQEPLAGGLFFKWIKQHLRIKRFFGTSENAVKSQVWIAVATYVLVAIVKKRLSLDLSLHSMLQILSVTPFEKVPLLQLLTDAAPPPDGLDNGNQLILL